MPHILLVVGSLRKESFNRQLANAITAQLEDKAECRELRYDDLPWINQDEEFPAPAAVQHARDELAWADGIWFVSPEYNGFFPGAVKNLIDWLSRPVVAGDYSTVAIAGKAATVSGAAGKSGSRTMQGNLCSLLEGVRASVMAEPTVGVQIPGPSWASNVLELSDADQASIVEQVAAFLEFIA
ncbi:MAG: NADPH-dependent FMN reductase [Coriobacteriales bacterium]|nr:NADPH-dependent FMN reductase [Coriobacteriales bacterium]